MQLPYVYRVTKYDPADRDAHGHYTGSEDTVSDHGEVEAGSWSPQAVSAPVEVGVAAWAGAAKGREIGGP
ncbi:hypothetical protein GTY85_00070 [Streptomyces sp. SID8377]|nr:hypothetical protein [Streptomyces sp. SID8377]